MTLPGSANRDLAPPRWRMWLDQPLSNAWCIAGWLFATIVFVGLATLLGGPTRADANVSIYSALAIAHGNFSCAYPPPGSIGFLSTAPFFQLLAGGFGAALRLGHGLNFPTPVQMGPNCSHSPASILDWALKSGAIRPVLWLGYLGWVALEAGTIAVMRASGRGRTRWEPAGVLMMALVPPVVMCIVQYFHPQDLLATGLALVGVASAIKGRWTSAGIWLGLALVSQQFALLILIPLVVCAPRRFAARFIIAVVVTVVALAVPLIAITSGHALTSIVIGTGASSASTPVLIVVHLHGPLLFAFARITPIVLSLAISWLVVERLGEANIGPVVLLSLIATSLSLRLVFEVNVWGYYFMAVSVLLGLVELTRGRIRPAYVLFLALISLSSIEGGIGDRTAFHGLHPWVSQLVLAPFAVALAVGPLVERIRQRRSDS